jgi:hypothetical protein
MVDFLLGQGMGLAHRGWHMILDFRDPEGRPRWEEMMDAKWLERDGKGTSFLAMHHHMMEMMRARFPNAPELEGWSNEELERAISRRQLEGTSLDGDGAVLRLLMNTEALAAAFDDSEALGRFLLPGGPHQGSARSGFHNRMHSRLSDWMDTVDMGDPGRNLMNRVFWKLHGFIDRVWMEFLEAKGLPVPREQVDYQAKMMELLSYPDETGAIQRLQRGSTRSFAL